MDRLPIWAAHDAAFGESEGLLIERHGSRYVGDREHGRYGAVLFLVEWINCFLSHGAPLSKTSILANTRGMVHLCFHTRADYRNRTNVKKSGSRETFSCPHSKTAFENADPGKASIR